MMPAERFRVLRVIARLNAGGPAHHVGILSHGLTEHGFDTVLAHGPVPPGEAMLADFDARYPTRRVEIAGLGPQLDPRDGRAVRRLIGLIRAFRPHIVHTHTAKAGFAGRLAALASWPRPLVVHTYHGHVLEGYFGGARSRAYRWIEQLLARGSDCLVGVSERTVSDLVRLRIAPRERFVSIPLGLELEPLLQASGQARDRVRRELSVARDEVLLVSIGRLVPIKRIDVALLAVARARRLGAPVRLAIVGDGPLRGMLELQARALELAGAVRFTGTRGDIAAIGAAADAMLLSSDNEGTPVALIEGAAAGKPALATAAGGVPEVVTPATGRLVAPGDWRALGEAIAELAAAPAELAAMGAAARRHVASRYGAARLLEDVDGLYRGLLAGR